MSKERTSYEVAFREQKARQQAEYEERMRATKKFYRNSEGYLCDPETGEEVFPRGGSEWDNQN